MTREDFAHIAPSIPHQPGVYQYYNAKKEIIYVGKAKDLRKRVASYFVKKQTSRKTERLVVEIDSLTFTIVNSEHDALLLENNLIKKYQPKYNIALRDDKSFPHLVIKKEPFPRVFITRKVIRDGSEYIGPFTNIFQLRELLDHLIASLPLRTCNLNLAPKEIAKKKYKPCLQYHIGNCKAPCSGFQMEEDYNWYVQQITSLVKGKNQDLVNAYKALMIQHAEKLEFEKAEIIKRKIEQVKNFQRKSIVANTSIDQTDVFGYRSVNDHLYVNYLQIAKGNIVHSFSQFYQKPLEEDAEEILPNIILQIQDKFKSEAKEIILRKKIELPLPIKMTIPRVGDKEKLLALSEKNADYLMQEEKRKAILHIKEKTQDDLNELIEQLQEDLSLPFLPTHIECFDNSNFQGSYPVAGMVCFKNGLPDKSQYRKFNIKTVEGINDFASMTEIVFRRYSRMIQEKQTLPQLIVIDGGKGQLSAAISALQELELMGKINVIGLAKNVEEIFFPGDSVSLKLPYDSESLKFLRRVRDEVHRFGVTFHRVQRSKGIIKNELEEIKGIGKTTATELLKKFKSVKKIKEATREQLVEIVGESKATLLYTYFNPND